MHRNLALVIVVVYALLLAILSLVPINGDVPHFGFSFDDKIYHLIAYFILTILLYVYASKLRGNSKILLVFGIAVIYGIIIEVLQEMLSSERASEIFDVIANVSGSLIAVFVILSKRKLKLK